MACVRDAHRRVLPTITSRASVCVIETDSKDAATALVDLAKSSVKFPTFALAARAVEISVSLRGGFWMAIHYSSLLLNGEAMS